MTIARDPRTGAVLGQVCAGRVPRDIPHPPSGERVTLLTRDGRYVTLPAHSVRLEELR